MKGLNEAPFLGCACIVSNFLLLLLVLLVKSVTSGKYLGYRSLYNLIDLVKILPFYTILVFKKTILSQTYFLKYKYGKPIIFLSKMGTPKFS